MTFEKMRERGTEREREKEKEKRDDDDDDDDDEEIIERRGEEIHRNQGNEQK